MARWARYHAEHRRRRLDRAVRHTHRRKVLAAAEKAGFSDDKIALLDIRPLRVAT